MMDKAMYTELLNKSVKFALH